MVGYAYQLGLIPLSEQAIGRAIELNGTAAKMNERAFFWGRLLAHDSSILERVATTLPTQPPVFELERFVADRVRDLTLYQNAAYGRRYKALVDRVQQAERRIADSSGQLAEAAARNYFKVLAYKDEYEVARLHTDGSFGAYLSNAFDGSGKKTFYMAPPLLTRRDERTGRRNKIALRGAWLDPLLRVLKHGKVLRGTPLDLFGRQQDRVIERALIGEFEEDVELTLVRLTPQTIRTAIDLLSVPLSIRGFGVVKERNYANAQPVRQRHRAMLLNNGR
jgi:indolepyruvate ferredoxin oxidoreductase